MRLTQANVGISSERCVPVLNILKLHIRLARSMEHYVIFPYIVWQNIWTVQNLFQIVHAYTMNIFLTMSIPTNF